MNEGGGRARRAPPLSILTTIIQIIKTKWKVIQINTINFNVQVFFSRKTVIEIVYTILLIIILTW